MVLTENREEEQDFILIEERKCVSLPCSPAKRVSPKKKQLYISQAVRNSDLIPRPKGKKSQRRQENTRFLVDLLEKDECCKDELEMCSNPALPTIFTEACTNRNYREPWADFMQCSGEEQERLLALLEKEQKQKRGLRGLQDHSDVNPAFRAQDCFQKIDRRLRNTLRKRQAIGTVEVLEENLLSFFNDKPHSVYTTNLNSSFERLLLHAVCQYMDLVSSSTDLNGRRQTEVMNKQSQFLPPSLLLSAYLDGTS